MSSSASGVSILAQTSTPEPVTARTASRSGADRTKETATLSIPSSRRTSSRSMSSGVGVVSDSLDAGAVTPGRPCTLPPAITLTFMELPSRSSAMSDTPPSPRATRSPSWRVSTSSGTDTPMTSALLRGARLAGHSTTWLPVSKETPPSGKGVVRILGPGGQPGWRLQAPLSGRAAAVLRHRRSSRGREEGGRRPSLPPAWRPGWRAGPRRARSWPRLGSAAGLRQTTVGRSR